MIAFKRQWRCYRPGEIVDERGVNPHGVVIGLGLADILVKRGFAEWSHSVPREELPVEVTAMYPPESAVKRKRGRPRKYPRLNDVG